MTGSRSGIRIYAINISITNCSFQFFCCLLRHDFAYVFDCAVAAEISVALVSAIKNTSSYRVASAEPVITNKTYASYLLCIAMRCGAAAPLRAT
jgi:hypothetical protein